MVLGVACFGFALDATASSSNLSWRAGTPGQVAALVVSPILEPKKKKKESVPEGGTTMLYLGLAGVSCIGAMILRSRMKAKETA
jgi:hypothetical protein